MRQGERTDLSPIDEKLSQKRQKISEARRGETSQKFEPSKKSTEQAENT